MLAVILRIGLLLIVRVILKLENDLFTVLIIGFLRKISCTDCRWLFLALQKQQKVNNKNINAEVTHERYKEEEEQLQKDMI